MGFWRGKQLKHRLDGLFSRWTPAPRKHLLSAMAAGAALVLLAVAASLWLLDQRVEHIKNQASQTNLKAHHTAQALRPLPDAWESVIQEIYSNDSTRQTPLKPVEVERPLYIKNARALPIVPAGTPKIAIVIDDVGVNATLSEQAEEHLPAEVTFSYLPYGSATMALAQKAREKGREVMIHLPMEPMPRPEEPPINPGDDALFVDLTEKEIRLRVRKNLKDLTPMAVGVNNHMGSRFTAYKEGLIPTFEEIDSVGLFFLDSLTTHESAVKEAAQVAAPNMPVLVRDVFLDHYLTEEALIEALVTLEDLARKNGKVIAIGHPHVRTVDVLEKWIPTLKHKGIALVPITHILPEAEADAEPPLKPATPLNKQEIYYDGLH